LGAIGTSWPLPSRSAREGKLMWRVKKHKKKKKKKKKKIIIKTKKKKKKNHSHIIRIILFILFMNLDFLVLGTGYTKI
jgi:hypothetical protein